MALVTFAQVLLDYIDKLQRGEPIMLPLPPPQVQPFGGGAAGRGSFGGGNAAGGGGYGAPAGGAGGFNANTGEQLHTIRTVSNVNFRPGQE